MHSLRQLVADRVSEKPHDSSEYDGRLCSGKPESEWEEIKRTGKSRRDHSQSASNVIQSPMHELNREGSIFGQFPLFSAALQRCQQSHSFESTETGRGKPRKGACCVNIAAPSDPTVASSSIDPSSHSTRSHGAQEVHPFRECGTPETALPVRDQRVHCRVAGCRTTSTPRSFPGRSEDCCSRIAPTPGTADHAQPRK